MRFCSCQEHKRSARFRALLFHILLLLQILNFAAISCSSAAILASACDAAAISSFDADCSSVAAEMVSVCSAVFWLTVWMPATAV